MNDAQCDLVTREAIAFITRREPAATRQEVAMFARGAVWGFRAGEATYREPQPTPAQQEPTP